MLFGLYIAKKLVNNRKASFTRTVVRLAVIAVSISIAVVLLSFGILLGFKQQIREKVSGYAGHVTISSFDMGHGSEHTPLRIDSGLMDNVRSLESVSSISPFVQKAGILKSDSLIEGLIFKGVPHDYDLQFYAKHLVKGKLPSYQPDSDSYEIMISEQTAKILHADTGSKLFLYFIEHDKVRQRRPVVAGIFSTGLQTFDKQFAISDLRMLQRLTNSSYDVATGYEVMIRDFNQLEESTKQIDEQISAVLKARNVKEQYTTIFQWLEIVDVNVLIIIVLMFVVAMINIITVLLILIIERIPMIGLLKAVGGRDQSIMQIFSWQGLFILLGGLFIGNALAFGLAYLQLNYQMVRLSPETYYMDAVPFYLPWSYVIAINLLTVILSYLFTLLPAAMVSRISPGRSLQFK